jgi:AAHS family 4-hydroxybenzoate transporter-like MFS transporter
MLAAQGLSLAISSQSLASWSLGGFGGPLMGFTIQRWGSRIGIGGFALIAAAGTLILGVLPLTENEIFFLMAMLFVENIFVSSLSTAGYVIATHIYPAECRATGAGMASALGRLGAMTSSIITVYALHFGGSVAYFAWMTLTCALTFIFALALRDHIPGSRGLTKSNRPSTGSRRVLNPI